jgi:hypothetical protein
MFGGFAVAYGLIYTFIDVNIGIDSIVIGALILGFWGILLLHRSGRKT